MRIVAISDTHNNHDVLKMPPGDILVHAGDATNRGTLAEVVPFLDWLGTQNKKYYKVILVPGNHDFLFEKDMGLSFRLCKDRNIELLIDNACIVDDRLLWGSPINTCGNWAFSHGNCDPHDDYRNQWQKIPHGIDILVTHGPPHNVLDHIPNYPDRLGCSDLRDKVFEIKPKVHIFGHIHEDHGSLEKEGIRFYNVSIHDENFYPSRQPTVIDI